MLCDGQNKAGRDYGGYLPKHIGHLATLCDCDASGIAIGIKINGATRIGVDLNSIQEINDINAGLALRIEDLQEGVKPNHHYQSLLGLLNNKGSLYEGLLEQQDAWFKIEKCQQYLQEVHVVDGEEVEFIEWLQNNRIELNTVLAAAKPTAVWNWLRWKLEQVWPDRNYNRAIHVDDYMLSPTMNSFIDWYTEQSKPVIKADVEEHKQTLSEVKGFYDDVIAEKEDIDSDIQDVLLANKKFKKIDLALKKIMDGFK